MPHSALSDIASTTAAPSAAARAVEDGSADLAMARYANGDGPAFAQVFSHLAPRLLRFLRGLTGSRALAEDLLQETLLKIHQARGQFVPGMPVAPWAYTVARHCYLDAVRSARRRPQLLAEEGRNARGENEVPIAGDAEQRLIAEQAGAAVQRALDGMTVARREAFLLLRYEGLSVAAAAEVLGVSEGAVKLRAFQAYKLIREELDKSAGAARSLPVAKRGAP